MLSTKERSLKKAIVVRVHQTMKYDWLKVMWSDAVGSNYQTTTTSDPLDIKPRLQPQIPTWQQRLRSLLDFDHLSITKFTTMPLLWTLQRARFPYQILVQEQQTGSSSLSVLVMISPRHRKRYLQRMWNLWLNMCSMAWCECTCTHLRQIRANWIFGIVARCLRMGLRALERLILYKVMWRSPESFRELSR